MGSAYNAADWTSFFSAEVGASAALVGLIFVAISINLPRIITGTQLIPRCAQALFILMGVLLASTFCLVPNQPAAFLGCELAGLGLIVWISATIFQRSASRDNPYVRLRLKVLHMTLTQLSTIPAVIAGVSLIVLRGGGLYWLVAGTIVSFTTALLDAWVLLIEIQR